jgi:predicted transcriptional regulator
MSDPITSNFQVVRLSSADAQYSTDHLRIFKDLLLGSETMYPGIDRWFTDKVLPGLRSTERIAYVGYLDETPVVSAVVKRGTLAKFCHLRITDELQNAGLGELFFCLMALEVKGLAKEIYFTLPESLWTDKANFFRSFNFLEAAKADQQYRFFEEELQSSASFSEVWKGVLTKLPKLFNSFCVGGHRVGSDLVLSIKADFAERIMRGEKSVEIRRKFSKKWIGHHANIYASAPTGGLVGEARIANVTVGKPDTIWKKYSSAIGCSFEGFRQYTLDASEVYALELDQIKSYRSPVMLTYASNLIGEELVPPQSYCTIENGKPWAKAVSVVALLHGLRSTPGVIKPLKIPSTNSEEASEKCQTEWNWVLED